MVYDEPPVPIAPEPDSIAAAQPGPLESDTHIIPPESEWPPKETDEGVYDPDTKGDPDGS